jgi:ABC transport system ATP-binding/permease protein
MNDYPALLDLTTRRLHPIGVSASFLVGRNETADVPLVDLSCSRHHFRIVKHANRYLVEPLTAQNPTYLNGRPATHREALEHGALVQAGNTRFQFLLRAQTDGQAAPPKAAAAQVPEPMTMLAAKDGAIEELVAVNPFILSGSMVIGREREQVQINLPHPQVSRTHARIALLIGETATLTDLNSANGTFVNGEVIRSPVSLKPGDKVDIGPYALTFTGSALVPKPRTNNVELVARAVGRIAKDRATGKPLTLLDDITLVIRPREFVCILGPSGSGKSTLLSSLSGRATPDLGDILLNGRELYAHFEVMKQDIAVVPQKDVLHESLTVQQALWYTAKLRLPPDTTRAELDTVLSELIETVGLTERRNTLIRHLSGGQVKRASLANEILCKPSLLFLDEVTSGLDEQTDRDVMSLFRSLADKGKTVVCITHSLANVERTCHLVVILTPGGKLAFVGKPAEALKYFRIDRLGDVYEQLTEEKAKDSQRLFRENPLWKSYVAGRVPPGAAVQQQPHRASSEHRRGRLRQFLRQTVLLTARYAAIWRGDALSVLAMMGQALVVALLLGLLFGDLNKVERPDDRAGRTANLVFLLAVSSYWFGCNNAAKEIVKERTQFRRERDFNLRVDSYYGSKLLLLTVFSAVQTLILFGIVCLWCHPPGARGWELAVLLTLAMTGVSLGLGISAFATSEEMAITLIPMAVIPQIILSGAISPLSGFSKVLALIGISTYWGKRALDGCLPEAIARAVPPLGLEQHSTGAAILVLFAHAAVAIVASLTILHYQSRRQRKRAVKPQGP